MNKYLLTVVLALVSMLPPANAQDSIWLRTFKRAGYDISQREIIETHDKGYLLTNSLLSHVGGSYKEFFAQLIKTDVNGEKLWEKDIGFLTDTGWVATDGASTRQTADGGYIVMGMTAGYFHDHTNGSVYIMKLNACGEKEWSKIYFRPDTQFPWDIRVLPDNTCLFIADYWDPDWPYTSNTWVMKIAADGTLLWAKMYADWEPGYNNNDFMWYLAPDNNNHFIVIGTYYKPMTPGGEPEYLRPMFIEIDTAGNEVWHNVYTDNTYIGDTQNGKADSKGNLYAVGQYDYSTENWPDSPGILYKLDTTGAMVWYKYMLDSSKQGRATTVTVVDDSLLFVADGYFIIYYDSSAYYFTKLDSAGNLLKKKLIRKTSYQDPQIALSGTLTTFDDKIVLSGTVYHNTNYYIELRKFNKNLEYDSVYTRPFTYDSLCPYPIVSDTILLDTTYVNIAELYKNLKPMSLYPNPVKEHLRVEINIVKGEKRLLRATNLAGKTVFSATVLPGRANLTVDVSSWPSGLYVFSLYEKGAVVQAEKVMVIR